MARALGFFVIALMVSLLGPASAKAEIPIGLDVIPGFDPLAAPNHVLLQWKPVNGAADYRVVWGPKSEPETRNAIDVKGKTRTYVKIPPGQATNVLVVARDKHGREITRSAVDVFEVPKGAVIGHGELQTHGTFQQATPNGSDTQDTVGHIQFQIYADPSLGDGKFRVYGLGNVTFKQVTVTTNGTVHTNCTAPVFVKGVLRYPTDAEEKTSDLCRLDLEITEAFKGRVADCTGSAHGVPVHDFTMDWSVTKKVKSFPIVKNHVVGLPSDVVNHTYTVKLTEIALEGKTGCTPK